MGQMLMYYFAYVFDTAHFFELFFLTASWVMLENKPWQNWRALGRSLGELLPLLAALILCDSLLSTYLTIYRSSYLLIWVLTQGVLSALYVFVHPRERSMAGFAQWCSMYAGSISLTAIGGQLSIVLSAMGLSTGWQGFARVALDAVSVLFAIYLNNKRLDKYDHIPAGGLSMILAGDVCLLLLRVLETRWFSLYYYFAVVLIAAYFCVLILVIFAVYAVDSICREQTRSLELLAEKQRAMSEQELVRLTEKQIDDLRRLRHDIKNQYSYMRILLAEKRYDELEEYFRRQDGELSAAIAPLDCGNRCVSIVLNMERQKAEAAGVTLNTKLVVPPVLPFPDDALCSLLSNLIDNAIDECVRLGTYFPKYKKQGVSVSINPGNPSSDYLYIEVRNPTDRKSLPRHAEGLVSTKGGANLHGYGTRIITRLARQYNGTALFAAENGVFTARVILDMVGKKEDET